MTKNIIQPLRKRPGRWLNTSLGAVALGVMVASGGAWASDSWPAPQCNPNKLYDILSSSFHQTAAQLADDRGWAGWGQQMGGGSIHIAPPRSIMGSTPVSAHNSIGNAFSGVKPLLVTTGSATSTHQTVALGNDGKFYAWGAEGTVLPSSYTTDTAVHATSLKLPNDVTADKVDMLFASYRFLAIVANGNVYTLVNGDDDSPLHGDGGSSDTDNGWHKVKTDASTDLSGVIAVRGQVGGGNTRIGAVMALTEDGEVFTWGNNIYNGAGGGRPSNSGTRLVSDFALQMTLPTPALDTASPVKQIDVTGGSNTQDSAPTDTSQNNSYYVLFENGELWSLGANTHRQLGDTTETWRTNWVQVQKPVNPNGTGGYAPFQDVEMFSVQEHDRGYAGSGSVGAIDSIGDVYTWGSNSGNMIGMAGQGNGGGSSNPQVQGDLLT